MESSQNVTWHTTRGHPCLLGLREPAPHHSNAQLPLPKGFENRALTEGMECVEGDTTCAQLVSTRIHTRSLSCSRMSSLSDAVSLLGCGSSAFDSQCSPRTRAAFFSGWSVSC